MRAIAVLGGALAALLSLIAFVLAAQYVWGRPHDAYVDLPFALLFAGLAILAVGAGLLTLIRPAMATSSMIVIAAFFLIAIYDSLGAWWTDAQAAFSNSTLRAFASNAGSLRAVQAAVVALVISAVLAAFVAGGTRATVPAQRAQMAA